MHEQQVEIHPFLRAWRALNGTTASDRVPAMVDASSSSKEQQAEKLRSLAYFPWVGACMGLLAGIPAAALGWFGSPAWLMAVVTLLADGWLTCGKLWLQLGQAVDAFVHPGDPRQQAVPSVRLRLAGRLAIAAAAGMQVLALFSLFTAGWRVAWLALMAGYIVSRTVVALAAVAFPGAEPDLGADEGPSPASYPASARFLILASALPAMMVSVAGLVLMNEPLLSSLAAILSGLAAAHLMAELGSRRGGLTADQRGAASFISLLVVWIILGSF